MSLRIVRCLFGVEPNTFAPTLWLTITKDDKVLAVGEIEWNTFDSNVSYSLRDINLANSLLKSVKEPPLTIEEIFLYKITKEY